MLALHDHQPGTLGRLPCLGDLAVVQLRSIGNVADAPKGVRPPAGGLIERGHEPAH